jgi:hypothetical protein
MYIYVYVCIYTYTYIYVYIYMYEYTYEYEFSGVKLPYFHRIQSQEDKDLIGDSYLNFSYF